MGAGAEVGAEAGVGEGVSTAGVGAGAGSGVGEEVGAGVVGITDGKFSVVAEAVAVSVCAGGGAEGGEAFDFVAATDSLGSVCVSDTALGGAGSPTETIFASFFSSAMALTSFSSCLLLLSVFFSGFTTDSLAAVLWPKVSPVTGHTMELFFIIVIEYCQAQFQLASSAKSSRTEFSLKSFSTPSPPPHPLVVI